MTKEQILALFPNASRGLLEANVQTHHLPQSPKPKRPAVHEPLAKEEGEGGYTGRILVRVTSFRRRLLDTDNVTPKYFIDCLRYCHVLRDDTEAEIDLRISQKKVRTKEEERTEIEIGEE